MWGQKTQLKLYDLVQPELSLNSSQKHIYDLQSDRRTTFVFSSLPNLFLIISLLKKRIVFHKAVLDVAQLLLETTFRITHFYFSIRIPCLLSLFNDSLLPSVLS